MQKETVTFEKQPEAVGYLTEQVIELKKMGTELQPPASDKHGLVEIEDACRIIRKAHSCQANPTNSKYPVWLHKESDGEVPHLHADVCRLDHGSFI